MAKAIRQSVTLRASPKAVYDALMDSRQHSRFTGSKAVISRRVGGRFTAYDGYASGKNLELVPGKKIVQTWRASEWPRGQVSKVTFSLRKVRTGTRLTFRQTGVDSNQIASIKKGWVEFYWEPMKKILGRSL